MGGDQLQLQPLRRRHDLGRLPVHHLRRGILARLHNSLPELLRREAAAILDLRE